LSASPPPSLPPAQVRRIVLGLLPSIFLGAIDGSILPIALLTIGRALGDVSLIAWVMAGYLVAGTVATPIYGKLSDLHGRRRMLLVAIGIAVFGWYASLTPAVPPIPSALRRSARGCVRGRG
jgi:MFS family permease